VTNIGSSSGGRNRCSSSSGLDEADIAASRSDLGCENGDDEAEGNVSLLLTWIYTCSS
jgi:hypothetical protein